jgi:hypothetical protein
MSVIQEAIQEFTSDIVAFLNDQNGLGLRWVHLLADAPEHAFW